MDIADKKVAEAIARQEKQIVKEMGQIFDKKVALTNDQTSIQYAKDISQKLRINYGSALSLVFWLDELLEIYPPDKKQANITKRARKRLIDLSRLIKIAGGQKGLSFCCSKLPGYAVNNFNSLLDMNDSWKKRSTNHSDILTSPFLGFEPHENL
ncbi:MAG: hypothetical protein V7K89_00020 [Nostoc sp.]|uniref:hypothetical protein n=1 Tax=Nostoc sp. TaxID=1180 RepID=UPI002FFACB73